MLHSPWGTPGCHHRECLWHGVVYGREMILDARFTVPAWCLDARLMPASQPSVTVTDQKHTAVRITREKQKALVCSKYTRWNKSMAFLITCRNFKRAVIILFNWPSLFTVHFQRTQWHDSNFHFCGKIIFSGHIALIRFFPQILEKTCV